MIIWINGSINSGKSTIAKLLAKEISDCAIVEIDALRDFIGWMPIDLAVPINLKNAVSVISNFADANLNVIVPYPLSERNYRFVNQELKNLKTKSYYITLAPKLEIALKDRGRRNLDDWDRSRIKHHYEIGIHNPSFGYTIDNSDQKPKETANEILGCIGVDRNG